MGEQNQLPDSKGTTAGKVLQWITVIGIGLTSLGPYIFPEKFGTERDEAIIHQDVETQVEEIKQQLKDELKKEISGADKVHREIRNDIRHVREQITALSDIDQAHEKHLKYHDGGLTNLADFMIREAEHHKSTKCDYEWRETDDGKEFIMVYKDAYGVDMIYTLHQKDNCQGYYTDILNNSKVFIR